MNADDFEMRLRALMDRGSELLPRLNRTDLELSHQYWRFMSEASEDELRRREAPQ